MIRERIGQTALRAYPPAMRQTRGLEMLGMLLDAGEQSTWAFVRESGSLVFGGLRERRTISARAGTRRLLADSSCQAVLICLALWLISALKPEVTAGPNHQLLVQEVVLPAILAAALIGYERIAAVSGLAAIAAFTPLGLHTQPVWLPKLLVPIARLLVMLCSPRKRPRDARRLLRLVPVCVLAALHAHADVSLPEVLAVVSAYGLLRLFHDPRLAMACSLAWLVWIVVLTPHASGIGPLGLGLPVILAATVGGLMLTAAGRLWMRRAGRSAEAIWIRIEEEVARTSARVWPPP
ncbi:MAG TPA: hypothetical protein VMA77_09065 [Solirubrobacteraceae bacterium]|nr:hypothetical protein [Solirubrobacteraceae bacterium]